MSTQHSILRHYFGAFAWGLMALSNLLRSVKMYGTDVFAQLNELERMDFWVIWIPVIVCVGTTIEFLKCVGRIIRYDSTK